MKIDKMTSGLHMPKQVPYGSEIVGTVTLHIGPGRIHAVIVRADRSVSPTQKDPHWYAVYFDRENCVFAAQEIDIQAVEVR